MSFGQAISSGFKNYAVFSGRATRSAFWWFYLFTVIVGIAISVIENAMGSSGLAGGLGIISIIWTLAVILPIVGLTIRRLHDTDQSGWWWLSMLGFGVGVIVLIVFMAIPGTQGDNKFGSPAIA